MKIFIDENECHFEMMKSVVYYFVIPCFIFELSTILYDWLMTSFCLQKVKKVYEADYVSNRKLTQKNFSSIDIPF